MKKGIIAFVLIIISVSLGFIVGFSWREPAASVLIWHRIDANQLSEDLDKIKLEVVSKTALPEGIGYSIKLKNGSAYVIKQNSVYVSFPVRNGNNGYSSNKAKVEAEGNKLDIRPGEEVTLNAFIPLDAFDRDKVDQHRLQYEIKGYINQVKDTNHYQQVGELFN